MRADPDSGRAAPHSIAPAGDRRDHAKALKISIAAIVAVMVIVIWAASAISIYYSREAALAEMKSNATNLAFAFDEEVTHTLDSSVRTMDVVAARMRVQGSDMDIYAWSRELPIVTGPIVVAGIIAPNGILIASTRAPDLNPVDMNDREHFRIQLDGKYKGVFIGKPVTSRTDGQILIPITERVETRDGRFVGVMNFELSPALLTNLHKSIDLGEHGTITLVGLDNIVRARFSKNSPDGLADVGKPVKGNMSQVDTLGVNQGFYIQQDTIDHVRRIHSFRRVANYPLFVNIGLGYDEGLASWWAITLTILAVAAGATLFLGGLGLYLAREIGVRRKAEQKVERLARTDPLTGLPNRRAFVEALHQAIGRTGRGGKGFAVLYLDLDYFKDVNDTLGHRVGDELLEAAGERLRSSIRVTDAVARFGGDEFAVLQTDIGDPADAAALAGKLIEIIAQPFSIEGNRIQSGTSIGIAVGESGTSDGETLLSHADLALYRAKSEGRGSYRFFTESMDTEVHARVKLADELREAIAHGQMILHYQPQVDVRDGRIKGLEALVRWSHPARGLLLPGNFIHIAEQTGLIAPLGRWVMNEACRQMKEWLDAGIALPVLAVNISATELKIAGIESKILAVIDRHGIPPGRIELEITEYTMMEVSKRSDDILERLRQHGIGISIDDFGMGYSSLAYMKRFRPSRIKIAGEFVSGMLKNEADRAVVRAIVEMAHELRVGLIAEGVETAAQAEFLCDLNCYDAQGFYFSRAVTAHDIAAILRSGKAFTPTERGAMTEVA
ncbi:MAG: putative bifunctional diguanylate cyclase/phosphodiesterase [Bradyrhizobium sp.]